MTSNRLRVHRLGIDMQHEAVVFMHKYCPVCRLERLSVRVRLRHGERSIIATLYQMSSPRLTPEEAGLSEAAWHRLGLTERHEIIASHSRSLEYLSTVCGKVYGRSLDAAGLSEFLADVVAGRYFDIHLASFITVCSA